MTLVNSPHQRELRIAGWRSRGYLPHFDGKPIPQFITLHLADSVPKKELERWQRELAHRDFEERKTILQRRIERYLDQGYGQSYLKLPNVAKMVQEALLKFENVRYRLYAWVVMPNHLHSLMKRFEGFELSDIMHSLKSYTAHEANKILGRTGKFWWDEYFDRYVRDAEHFKKIMKYIENNPVKAGLCKTAEEWPFSSAYAKRRLK